ncbi:hypothetical protein BC833DRAFT_565015 [Globomyces pollinis-pini]|nr:hypothetical protein BC833DRAFT_565015 [Globomyces pollinis-pini]KAJ2996810.1 hypothetical protein HDV02_006188 [Globomyces sp. JEL0801]
METERLERNRTKSAINPTSRIGTKSANSLAVRSPLSIMTAKDELDVLTPKVTAISMGNISAFEDQHADLIPRNLSLDNEDIKSSGDSLARPISRPRLLSKSLDNSTELIPRASTSNTNYSAIVRSKSTYSISLSMVLQLETKAKQIGSVTSLQDNLQTQPSNVGEKMRQFSKLEAVLSAASMTLLNEDGFLKEIEMKGFSGIWNHPVTRSDLSFNSQ